MTTRQPSGAAVLELPGLVADPIRLLWFAAGAGMLLLTAFVAVLLLAGLGFRLGPRARGRPVAVFGVSAVLVLACAAALLLPGSLAGVAAAARLPSARLQSPTQPAGADQTGTGGRLSHAAGTTTGAALAATTARSLILYDPGTAGELHATLLANLVSHFGGWTAHPVATYRAGEMAGYTASFYLGSTATTLPAAFLKDVTLNRYRVVWIGSDIEQVTASGFTAQGTDADQFVQLVYKGAQLPMDPGGGASYTRIAINASSAVTVLATAARSDGSTAPWAVRSGNLTYVSENPLLSQTHPEGRNLAFADLLYDALNPAARTRHRALIRLEDVNPTSDPAQLRAVIDYLSGRKIPFSVGVYPVFRDPNGVGGAGDVTIRLTDRPALVAALAYATAHGGSLVLHGYTHQYGTKDNPSDGRSGDDAEFYLCHLTANQQLQLDGHVPEDAPAWALGRVDQALTELDAAGLPRPSMFEFPHYMASAVDYLAVGQRFEYRYERSLYFPGVLAGTAVDDGNRLWQMFPYAVRDVYGTAVLPENLDYVHSDGSNIPQMLAEARANLTVRDGVASFFYHPFLGVANLPRLVDGLQALGYTFVPARDLAGAA